MWKRPGGKVVDVAKPDIQQVTWLRVPKGYQLALRLAGGSKVKFAGFREQVSPFFLYFFFLGIDFSRVSGNSREEVGVSV